MREDPRTLARLEEEGDLITTVDNWEIAKQVCEYLYEKWPMYVFTRTGRSFSKDFEISVKDSPSQVVYNQMQGYAMAINRMLKGIMK